MISPASLAFIHHPIHCFGVAPMPPFQSVPNPNKVYIGGLPEFARKADLESWFSEIGAVRNVDLKYVRQARLNTLLTQMSQFRRPGYGFVEFYSRKAARESVARYHEGDFMGYKIQVEPSYSGWSPPEYIAEPGPCFNCGEWDHWVRYVNSSRPRFHAIDLRQVMPHP